MVASIKFLKNGLRGSREKLQNIRCLQTDIQTTNYVTLRENMCALRDLIPFVQF